MLFDAQAALSEILATIPATPATPATNTLEMLPLSRVSQVSQGIHAKPKIPFASTRAAIVQALRAGLKTPGSIATATKRGATVTYQELNRMAQAGLVTVQPNGALALTAAADLEANL